MTTARNGPCRRSVVAAFSPSPILTQTSSLYSKWELLIHKVFDNSLWHWYFLIHYFSLSPSLLYSPLSPPSSLYLTHLLFLSFFSSPPTCIYAHCICILAPFLLLTCIYLLWLLFLLLCMFYLCLDWEDTAAGWYQWCCRTIFQRSRDRFQISWKSQESQQAVLQAAVTISHAICLGRHKHCRSHCW